MIPFAWPLAQYESHKRDIDAAVARVLQSGRYILGRETAAFETAFAAYCESNHAVGVASGTDALTLALRAFGIGAGDEVITVSHTAIATVAAILAAGATPVLVDADPVHYTLDPACLEAAVSAKVKAIVPVHLYGQPADMAAICAFAERHGLKVIEDCAQATGGTYKGRRLGSIGAAGCFSFFPTKNLGAIGDGGIVVTADDKAAERLRRLRQYGWDERRHTTGIGVNSRLDEIQAAILAAKLPSLDGDNARRVGIAARYTLGLKGLPLTLPAMRPQGGHVHHLYVIACDDRNELKAHLEAHGVAAAIHYPLPGHRHPGYANRLRVPKDMPVTDKLVSRILSLPIYPELSDEQVDSVIAAIKSHYHK